MKDQINKLVEICFNNARSAGWHTSIGDPKVEKYLKPAQLMLMVSEISEAMEGERKNLMDTHLPNRPMAEVELADLLIRLCDYAGRWGYDLGGAVVEKMQYNANREDHKIENRLKEGGKKF